MWRELMAEQKRSGQSIRAFCRERGHREHAFYFWRKRLNPAVARKQKPIRFALVETAARQTNPGIELTLAGGECLRIAAGADAATLRMILGVLREARA